MIANASEILQRINRLILRNPATGVERPTPVRRAI